MPIAKRITSALRAAAFKNPAARWLKLVPTGTRLHLRLDPPPEGSRRVEIGSGHRPRAGYVHVDRDPRLPDIDLIARGEKIPLPPEWADEVCVHAIEHLPPYLLRRALSGWHALLRPGGKIAIHAPNVAAVGFSLLRSLLETAGFVEVEDATGRDASRHHQNDGAPFITDFYLEVRARKPEWQREHETEVAGILEQRDPAAIKRLYLKLGESFERAYSGSPAAVPVLSNKDTVEVVRNLLSDVGGLVLDAGCGPNPATAIEIAKSTGRRVVGLDISPASLRLARLVAASSGVGLLLVAGDVEALPFREASFAGVVCGDTIEHLPDDIGAVSELARVMQPEGRLVIATPNRRSLSVTVRRLKDLLVGNPRPANYYYAASSHLREYTWSDLEEIVPQSLRLHKRATAGWSGDRLRSLASLITSLPPFRGMARTLVLELEKVVSEPTPQQGV